MVNAGAAAGQRRFDLDTGGQVRRTPFPASPCDVEALSDAWEFDADRFRSAVESVAR